MHKNLVFLVLFFLALLVYPCYASVDTSDFTPMMKRMLEIVLDDTVPRWTRTINLNALLMILNTADPRLHPTYHAAFDEMSKIIFGN